jgi:hypothetical protein
MTDGTTKRPGSSKAERLFRKQRGAGSSPARASTDDSGVIPPPASMTVDDRRVVLFDSQNRPLVRRIGF